MKRAREVLRHHIAAGVTPGATAAVVRGEERVAAFAEGRHTYDSDSRAVELSDRYDLASLTKLVTATACMLLEEDGAFTLDDTVNRWVADFDRGGREAVTIRHLLAHCSGLPAHRPLYDTCGSAEEFLRAICAVPLESEPGRVTAYSDLGFILLGSVLERASGMGLEPLLVDRVLNPLGMTRTGFCPSADLLEQIPPTEESADGLIHGQVHDDNARAMGGVAPHAGLFGTAADMARLVMAYLNGGRLGAEQVLPAKGAARYVERANLVGGSTRALGWDTVSATESSAGKCFSVRSFGHLGFTGTSVWADPETGLGVVLLTNRVHPTRENDGIRRLRPAFHDAVVDRL